MATNESARCQYIDLATHMECTSWYPYEDGQKFCEYHRNQSNIQNIHEKEANISKVTIFNGNHIQALNQEATECEKMSIPELIIHIKGIEEQIKALEFKRRAANIAKRNLEDRLSEEERAALRQESTGFKVETRGRPKKYPAKSTTGEDREAKASSKKTTFAAWAQRLGMKSAKDLMLMDDDEREARIAKYKASHPSS